MITKYNILIHELIGLEAEVVRSTSKHMIGIEGIVVDETKNLIVLEEKGKIKKIPKISSKFRFYLPGNRFVDINGADILYQPENRPKKLYRKIR